MDDEPSLELRSDINLFFALIVKRYALFFQSFDGDDSAEEIKVLSKRLYNYLHKQKSIQKPKVETTDIEEKKSLNPMRYILWLVGVSLVVYIGYLSDRWLDMYNLEQRIESEYSQEIDISSTADTIILDGYVDSATEAMEIEKMVSAHNKKPIINRLRITPKNMEKMIDISITKYQRNNQLSIGQIEQNIKQQLAKNNQETKILTIQLKELQRELNSTKESIHTTTKELKSSIDRLSKERGSIKQIVDIESQINQELKEALSDNPYYIEAEHMLDFRNLNLFSANKTEYNPKSIKDLRDSFEKYISILQKYREYISSIVIEGYTDSSGKREKNIELSSQRAKSIEQYLLEHSSIGKLHLEKLLHARGMGAIDIVKVGEKEDKAASRRIRIRFYIKNRTIFENIKKILHD